MATSVAPKEEKDDDFQSISRPFEKTSSRKFESFFRQFKGSLFRQLEKLFPETNLARPTLKTSEEKVKFEPLANKR